MPRFQSDNGRTLSARSGSFLERRLLRDGWTVVSEDAPGILNLNGKTRAELNAIAADLGVENPESFPNIAAVKAAIQEA
jgi:hypothetical protein